MPEQGSGSSVSGGHHGVRLDDGQVSLDQWGNAFAPPLRTDSLDIYTDAILQGQRNTFSD